MRTLGTKASRDPSVGRCQRAAGGRPGSLLRGGERCSASLSPRSFNSHSHRREEATCQDHSSLSPGRKRDVPATAVPRRTRGAWGPSGILWGLLFPESRENGSVLAGFQLSLCRLKGNISKGRKNKKAVCFHQSLIWTSVTGSSFKR